MSIESVRAPLTELAAVTAGILSERAYPQVLSLAYMPKSVQLSPSKLRKASHQLAPPAGMIPVFEAIKDGEGYAIASSLPYPSVIWRVGMFSAKYALECGPDNATPIIGQVYDLCDTQWKYDDQQELGTPITNESGMVIRGLASTLRMIQEGYPIINGDWSWVSVTGEPLYK